MGLSKAVTPPDLKLHQPTLFTFKTICAKAFQPFFLVKVFGMFLLFTQYKSISF